MFKMNKTVLFIDSGYLSFMSKHFGKGKPLKYKIEKFAENICKERNLECEEIYYFAYPRRWARKYLWGFRGRREFFASFFLKKKKFL